MSLKRWDNIASHRCVMFNPSEVVLSLRVAGGTPSQDVYFRGTTRQAKRGE